ncbi:hypothetical protein GCM10007391_11220 [Alteromonas halophila]|uniref:PEP-CTERM system TPR-repeat protein PrsT n=2 Tax=Alteromonas halophila TaxID=516698 RepID=A0A918MX89_9ALTE|nr:hypothetical protein GCM10007391_11220 [Alteromonas halophila]
MCVIVLAATTGCSEKSVDTYLEEARAKAQQGDVKAAVIEYKNAIKRDPEAPLPRFELGKLYLENKDFASAEKELSKARELGYSASQVLPLLAQSYQQTGAENALADVDHTTQGMSSAERAEVGFYKVQALLELEKEEEALALIEELKALDTTSVYKGLLSVFEDAVNENMEAARDRALALYEQAPLNKDVLVQLARLHLANDDMDKATATYKEYVQAFPDDLPRQFTLVALLIEQRKLDDAEPYVDDLLAASENHPILNQYKGLIAASQGNYELALSRFETAVQNGNADPVVRLVAGYAAYQLQNFAGAKKHLSMIASNLPDNHPGLRMLAHSLLQQGDSEDAYEVMSRFEGNLENDVALFSSASLQLLREGNVVDARALVDKTAPLSDSPQELAKLGVLQLSLNDVSGLVNLEAAVEGAPDSVAAQSALIRAYLMAGDTAKARDAAQTWRTKAPDSIEPLLALANIAIDAGQTEQAESYISEAIQSEQDAPQLTYTQVRLAIATDSRKEAATLLTQRLDAAPDDVTALAMLYALKREDGNTASVISRAQQQLAQSDDLRLRLLLARMQMAEQKPKQALTLLKDIEASKDKPLLFWQLKGQLLIALNDVDAASAHYRQWLDYYPQNENAVSGMVLILDAQRRYQDALMFVEKALAKQPNPQLLILKAYFHTMLNETQAAWDIIKPLSQEAQSLPFVRGIRARLLVKDGQPKAAIPHALAAYESRSNPMNAVLVTAAYELSERPQDAFAFLEQHVDGHPDDTRAAMLLAERMIARDKDEAMSTYETILQKTPENFVVLNNLAYLYFEKGETDRAATLAQRAVELRPENADAVDTLAQIRLAQGRDKDALALYKTISGKDIANEEVYLNHVELLLKTGNTALAKRRLEERKFTLPASQQRARALSERYSL